MGEFEDREAAHEKRFAMEEDKKFQARVRRDRLVGLWAAQWLEMEGSQRDADAEAFAKAQVGKDDEAIAADLSARFEQAGKPMDAARIRRKLAAAEAEAAALAPKPR